MKSLALSLLVALGVSLGAASASAETPAAMVSTKLLSSMQDAARLAKEHSERAQQYRVAARVEHSAAQDCLRIAADNDKQGFPYYAAKMREKAAQHQQAANANMSAANREEALAQRYRAQAQQYLQGQPQGRK